MKRRVTELRIIVAAFVLNIPNCLRTKVVGPINPTPSRSWDDFEDPSRQDESPETCSKVDRTGRNKNAAIRHQIATIQWIVGIGIRLRIIASNKAREKLQDRLKHQEL